MKEQFKNMKEKLYTLLTLVNASVGNDTPREKPKTTPTKVARVSKAIHGMKMYLSHTFVGELP